MSKKLHFVVIAVDGSVASAVFAPLEIFQACNIVQANMPHLDPVEISWEVLSPNGNSFLASSGYKLPVDGGLKDLPKDSIIFFPGFGLVSPLDLHETLEKHQDLGVWLKRQHDFGCTIAAGCAGNFLLIDAGLIKKEKVTTSWLYAELFKERYPDIELDLDSILIQHEKIISVGGLLCGLDLVLSLIQRFVHKEVAQICTKMMVLENRHPSKVPFEQRQSILHNDPMIAKAVDWIRDNLHQRFTLADVVEHVHTSRRNLSRRFKQETGESFQDFVKRSRINRAKILLETSSLSIEKIAEEVSFSDNSAFSRTFKNHTTLTPKEYRQRFKIQA